MSVDMSLWCAAEGVIAVLVIFGNCLSIIVFLTNPRLRRMRTSILLINLSVADLIVGSLAIPMYIALLWPGTNFALVRNFEFYLSYLSVDLLTGFGSVIGLTVIAVERVYSVFMPHRHRNTKRRVYYALVVLIWMLAALQTILRIVYAHNIITFTGFFYCMFSFLSVCLCIICSSYVAVWARVYFADATAHAESAHARDHKSETKLAVTLAIITALFILTWVPFHILNMVMFYCVSCQKSLPLDAVYFFKLLHYSNSLINPIVYSSRFPEFKRTIKKLVCCMGGHLVRVGPQPTVTNREHSHINHLALTNSPHVSPVMTRKEQQRE